MLLLMRRKNRWRTAEHIDGPSSDPIVVITTISASNNGIDP
jgi:hypothetical protein